MLTLSTAELFWDPKHRTLSEELSSLNLWNFPRSIKVISEHTGKVANYRYKSSSYGNGMATYSAGDEFPKLVLFND